MRYSKRGYRALRMLMDRAVPVRADGAIDLCQDCQRRMWFAGGYVEMLATQLGNLARQVADLQRYFLTNLRALTPGQSCGTCTRIRERAVQMAKDYADEHGWTILIQRRGSEGLRIIRLARDRDGTRSAETACPAPVPKDCQARAEGIAKDQPQ